MMPFLPLSLFLPPGGLTGVGQYPFPPWRGRWGWGGRGAVLTPTRTLPHRGGGERVEGAAHEIPTPVSPWRGRIQVGENAVLLQNGPTQILVVNCPALPESSDFMPSTSTEASKCWEFTTSICVNVACPMVYPRTFYTDLNGLFCKAFKAAMLRCPSRKKVYLASR